MNKPQLIVMLTYNDKTVLNAREVFEKCENSKAVFWGMKEEPLTVVEMKKLYEEMKRRGKTTFLEVVAYTKEEGLKGAKLAVECKCDILMGTIYCDEINDYCKKHNLKYMPFVGKITGRPSVLMGEIDDMINEANEYIKKGVYGIDLLGYRYVNDAFELNKRFVKEVKGPVCLAGSINNYQRLDEVLEASPWSFTIGSAFFDNKFGDSFADQIDKVCNYMLKDKK